MKSYRIKASAIIKAPAKNIYALLADYRDGHPHILPKKYFSTPEIEKGGVGAGTVIRFQMTVMGKTQPFRVSITEPEPGRVLVETDVETGTVTTFTVNPTSHKDQSNVTIATELKSRNGFLGILERFTTTRLLNRIYKEELKLIQTLADERSGS